MEDVSSFSDIDKLIWVLRRDSRFFVGPERSELERLTETLQELDNFLENADEDSADELMRESVKTWLEETNEEPQVKGYAGDCVLKLSRLLQEPRIVDFLNGACLSFRLGRLRSVGSIFLESEPENSTRDYANFDIESDSTENDSTELFNKTRNGVFESESENGETLSVNNDPTVLISSTRNYENFDSESENSSVTFSFGIDSTLPISSTRNTFFDIESENSERLSDEDHDLTRFQSSRDRFFDSESESREELSVDDEETGSAERQNRKPFYSFLEEYVDSAAKNVTDLLLDGTTKRSVISIVGPSGIGKTILARKVYDNAKAAGDLFDFCGWIDVPPSHDRKEVLKALLKLIAREDEGIDGMRMMELLGALRQALQPKRYMFVFDDVFQEDFWHFIKQGLPDNENKCRIIVATRGDTFVDSCQICSFDHVYCLGPLSNIMAYELFVRTAFYDMFEQLCPSELEQVSVDIIRMCKGFPFPIVAVAGLLSTKEKIETEWKKIHDSFLDIESDSDPPSALDVLALSFLDLPNHLRPCFLYFSIFPEQSLIPTDKLFKLWIAEGFVEEKKGTTLEEVAEEHLNELVERNLVEACQDFQGLEKFCQVHRLIHSMARAKAEERNFCHIRNEEISNFRESSTRLSIYNVPHAFDMIARPLIRSVFLFNAGSLRSSFLVTLMRTCENLTLLDLENVPIEFLPYELGNLVHLMYLSLKNTKVKRLPDLSNLQNLQTFDLRNTLVNELPLEINKLNNLRHLLAGVSTRGVKITQGIIRLEKLHTLTTVDINRSAVGVIKELAKLRRLRKLGISGLTAEDGIALCTALDALIHLETLTLQAKSEEVLKLQTISTMLTHLRCLVLKGQLPKFPYLIVGLPNLTTLCLSLSKLTNDPLRDLHELPNLVSLWLYRAYEGEKLNFEPHGFQRLKLLVLTELQGLNSVEIQEGALPCLEELRIGLSPLLKEVPSGIEHLRSLKVFANYDMPREFVIRIQPNGFDYLKVMHIPSVTFWYRVEGKSYKVYKLGDSELLDHIFVVATNIDVELVKQQYELEQSFCDSEDEEVEEDEFDQLSSLSSSRSFFQRNNASQWSFSSGFYTDDVEE